MSVTEERPDHFTRPSAPSLRGSPETDTGLATGSLFVDDTIEDARQWMPVGPDASLRIDRIAGHLIYMMVANEPPNRADLLVTKRLHR